MIWGFYLIYIFLFPKVSLCNGNYPLPRHPKWFDESEGHTVWQKGNPWIETPLLFHLNKVAYELWDEEHA